MGASCNDAVHVFLSQGVPLPPQFWSFEFGAVAANSYNYTDVIDLGENNRYTLLIARKSGASSDGEYLEIYSSVDGVQWAVAFRRDGVAFVARHQPSGGRQTFCVWGRPVGRYVRALYYNGSTNQNDLVIDLAAYSGI